MSMASALALLFHMIALPLGLAALVAFLAMALAATGLPSASALCAACWARSCSPVYSAPQVQPAVVFRRLISRWLILLSSRSRPVPPAR
jgi:hypothetical protein